MVPPAQKIAVNTVSANKLTASLVRVRSISSFILYTYINNRTSQNYAYNIQSKDLLYKICTVQVEWVHTAHLKFPCHFVIIRIPSS